VCVCCVCVCVVCVVLLCVRVGFVCDVIGVYMILVCVVRVFEVCL